MLFADKGLVNHSM